MDVVSDLLRLLLTAKLHGFIGDGKACMHTHHALDEVILQGKSVLCKVNIFLDSGMCLFFTVTIGNLIAKNGTYAEVSGSLFDGEKGTGNLSEGSMVIEDGGYSVLDTL